MGVEFHAAKNDCGRLIVKLVKFRVTRDLLGRTLACYKTNDSRIVLEQDWWMKRFEYLVLDSSSWSRWTPEQSVGV